MFFPFGSKFLFTFRFCWNLKRCSYMKANDPKIRAKNVCGQMFVLYVWIYRRRPERLCFSQKQEKETEAEALLSSGRPADGLRPADLWWSGWCWRPKSWWTALWLRSSPAGRSSALLFLYRGETDALARTETRTRFQQEGKKRSKRFPCRSSPRLSYTETKDTEEIHFHDCSLINKH